jgi:hypothetical protein
LSSHDLCHLRVMKRLTAAAIAAAALCVGAPGAAVAHSGPAHWPLQKVMQRIDGKRIHIRRRALRIDLETTLCSGLGPAVRQRGMRTWKHFDCTYSAFIAGRGIYDCDFRVHVLAVRDYLITNARWTSGSPDDRAP